jgi:hypothetical protein
LTLVTLILISRHSRSAVVCPVNEGKLDAVGDLFTTGDNVSRACCLEKLSSHWAMAATDHMFSVDGKSHMSDIVFVALIVGFFVVSGLYVRFCDKL